MTTCVRCGREGSRGYQESVEGPVCSSRNACDERVETARLAVGLHRIDRVGKYGPYHFYKLDGQRVRGVTTILDSALPKPALVDWAARVTARYAAEHLDELWGIRHMGLEAVYNLLEHEPRSQRDSAGVRGSQLHVWAEDMIHGREVTGITNELLPWVLSVRDFIEDWQPKPVLLESPVASRRWGYAGTLDLVADFPAMRWGDRTFPAGRRIVDYKSSRGVYSETALQMGAYKGAELYAADGEERPMSELEVSDWGLIVHIRPEGYQVFPVYVGEEVLHAFARVKWMSEFLKRDGLLDSWLGDALPAPTRG